MSALESFLSFRLSDEFVDSYADRTPPWGFPIGGGNTLGEITWLTKYARTKPDGSKERWHEGCRRVVEGTYSILKNHCMANRTPWNAQKAQRAAEDMFERLFMMKWTPPGRGLWMMGTEFLAQEGSASLQNCFQGGTEFITRSGPMALSDAVGEDVEVWAGEYGWAAATVQEFGVQPLQRITFAPTFRSNRRVVETATPDHRWYLSDGSETTDLKVGDRVPMAASSLSVDGDEYEAGFLHGLAFADGSINYRYKNGDYGMIMRLCGDKAGFVQMFDRHSFQPNCEGDPVAYHRFSFNFKEVPSNGRDPSYKRGFVDGWIEFDGWGVDGKSGPSLKLDSQDAVAVEWLVDNAASLGWIVSGHSLNSRSTNFGERSAPLHRVTLRKSDPDMNWRVVSIEPLDEKEVVYCAVVPGAGRFTLASGVLTGNCSFISTEKLGPRNPTLPFSRLMEMSMLGIGVGFDTRGAGKLSVHAPDPNEARTIVIDDSREGWCDSVDEILRSYLLPGMGEVNFDYSLIRPAGAPIKRFGGTAAGPEPLKRLHREIRRVLGRAKGQSFDSVLIADIGNMIGKCVVAGNVRRCLPAGTLVHTTRGGIPIEDVAPGDVVVTAKGKGEVTNWFDQGVQETIVIRHQHGTFTCTPSHQVAVFDSMGDWTFKRAGDLSAGDRMVWDPSGYDGVETEMPAWRVERNPRDTRSLDLTVPELDAGSAWLIGLIQGDGYAFVPTSDTKTPNGYVSIACSPDHPEVVEKAVQQIRRWGMEPRVKEHKGDRAVRIEVYSTGFAKYIHAHVKQPKTEVFVPEWIRNGLRSVRGAYLAGVFDADGSDRNRPLQAVSTVYREWLSDLIKTSSSLGISMIAKTSREGSGKWQTLYAGNIVGPETIRAWESEVSIYSAKYQGGRPSRSANGFTFPTEMVRAEGHKGDWIFPNPVQSCARMEEQIGPMGAYPLEVIGIEEGPVVPTYDIEVKDLHQFTAEGIVVHNSAEIILGDPYDRAFLQLKDWEMNPERNGPDGWGHLSNNSVLAEVGMDLDHIADLVAENGEPGAVWIDLMRSHGRLVDPRNDKDHRAMGCNPCAEQTLEHMECCTLVETFPSNCEDLPDFLKTLKVAYLYAKAVTLLPTHWPESNEVMSRNRRIGTSMTGLAQFAEREGWPTLREWSDAGYREIVSRDKQYSEWLGVRESIKTTSIKPSGTVSLLAGVTPGVHWPVEGGQYLRTVRYSKRDPVVDVLRDAGYHVEPSVTDPESDVVVTFPTIGPDIRGERDVSVWEKVQLASLMQRWWADNMVSATFTFRPDERDHVGSVLRAMDGQMKSMSFLPLGEELEPGAYPQMPYQSVSDEDFDAMLGAVSRIDIEALYSIEREAEGERFCNNDVCEIH